MTVRSGGFSWQTNADPEKRDRSFRHESRPLLRGVRWDRVDLKSARALESIGRHADALLLRAR
ncbi:hypothetical protein AFL01nite_04930 [Aeromicrobium flavum]|uniref:Uncharacterized protein n=1 Tax=Aeromicrobium flavum TaxID=416568 RepID=A0A512HRV2_9ACTN|nr:hypothetical protein AFL01nite_04930 [Aeromicrobium flavum]